MEPPLAAALSLFFFDEQSVLFAIIELCRSLEKEKSGRSFLFSIVIEPPSFLFSIAKKLGINRDLPQPSSRPSSERPVAPMPPISAEASRSSICGLQTDLLWLFIPATKVLFVDLWPTNRVHYCNQSADVKKQTVFFLQTADVWSTSSTAEDCRCGPQTADVLTSEKQTAH
ncbi:hypothetical protein LXL04_019383 [Taraxacum kok-saghyz]